jgi:hypothetical protein
MPTRKPAAKKVSIPEEPVKPKAVKAKAKAKPDAGKETPKTRKAAAPAMVPPPVEVEEKAPKIPKNATGSRKAKPAPAPEPIAVAPGLEPAAQVVLDALRQGRALEFIFENGDANPPRTFEPRLLCFDALSKAWYVWGWDRRYNAERHHRLDLLKEINQVDGLGRAAQGPFKDGTPANLIGGWLGGEPIPVKAILMKQWIFAVKQAPPPFPSFQIEDIEDGKATVSFVATDLRAISRWCMQFGDGIQVLEPQRLVDRIKQVGIAWGGKPKPEAEPNRPVAAPPPPRATPPPSPPKRDLDEKPKGKNPRVEIRTERL